MTEFAILVRRSADRKEAIRPFTSQQALLFAGGLIGFGAFGLLKTLQHRMTDLYPVPLQTARLAFAICLVMPVIQRRRRL